MDIGKKVNERRKELGLNLRELGELCGLTAGFLSQIENDQVSPSLNSLTKYCHCIKSSHVLSYQQYTQRFGCKSG